jgi:hypothetical protein
VPAGQVGGTGGMMHVAVACSWLGSGTKGHAACMHDE